MLALHFLQNAGYTFHSSAYLLNRGIQIIFSMFADNVFKFDNQFPDIALRPSRRVGEETSHAKLQRVVYDEQSGDVHELLGAGP